VNLKETIKQLTREILNENELNSISTMEQFIHQAEDEGHIFGDYGQYILDAARMVAKGFDALPSEEQKVMRDTYYKAFLRKIGKVNEELKNEAFINKPNGSLINYLERHKDEINKLLVGEGLKIVYNDPDTYDGEGEDWNDVETNYAIKSFKESPKGEIVGINKNGAHYGVFRWNKDVDQAFKDLNKSYGYSVLDMEEEGGPDEEIAFVDPEYVDDFEAFTGEKHIDWPINEDSGTSALGTVPSTPKWVAPPGQKTNKATKTAKKQGFKPVQKESNYNQPSKFQAAKYPYNDMYGGPSLATKGGGYYATKENMNNTLANIIKEELLNEVTYSKFKNEVKNRTKAEQLHKAIREVKRKLQEIDRIVEYTSRMKAELSEGDGIQYWTRTNEAITTISEMVNVLNNKIKNLQQ
jgi:hypothetical protein